MNDIIEINNIEVVATFCGVPEEYAAQAKARLDKRLLNVVEEFRTWLSERG